MAEPMGFFTDPTVCIGCKACEVACKQWNQLPALDDERKSMSGNSYDNTRKLDGTHWRHVKFVEQFDKGRRLVGHDARHPHHVDAGLARQGQ